MQAIDLEALQSKTAADQALARTVTDSATRAFILTNLVRRSGGEGWRWRVNLAAIQTSLPELARWDEDEWPAGARYEGNTLFIKGGQSKFLRSSHVDEITKSFGAFSITTLRTAAHWIHADEPEALQVVVSRFLRYNGS